MGTQGQLNNDVSSWSATPEYALGGPGSPTFLRVHCPMALSGERAASLTCFSHSGFCSFLRPRTCPITRTFLSSLPLPPSTFHGPLPAPQSGKHTQPPRSPPCMWSESWVLRGPEEHSESSAQGACLLIHQFPVWVRMLKCSSLGVPQSSPVTSHPWSVCMSYVHLSV